MYSLPVKVYPSACDENGRMKLYRVMQTMQDCSELWLHSEPVFENYFRDNGMGQLLAYRQLDILRVTSYGEDLRVATSVYEVNALFGLRNTCIYDADDRPCYVSWGMGAFVNRATGRLQKVPEDVQHSVCLEPPVPMEYTERRIVIPQHDFRTLPDIPVRHNDIDYNCHVNNAEYLRMALELLPDGFVVQRVRIEYKVPARLGDVLSPAVCCLGGEVYVVLRLEGHVSTVFCFSGGADARPSC